MRRMIVTLALTSTLLAALPQQSAATRYTGAGAKASFRSATNVALGTVSAPNSLSTSITHILAGTVLTIQVSVAAIGGSADFEPYIVVYPGLPGCFPEPMLGAGATINFCHAHEYCVITMNYFCDVDQSIDDIGPEIIGNPINTTVQMFENHNAPAGTTLSWSVATRLEPKN